MPPAEAISACIRFPSIGNSPFYRGKTSAEAWCGIGLRKRRTVTTDSPPSTPLVYIKFVVSDLSWRHISYCDVLSTTQYALSSCSTTENHCSLQRCFWKDIRVTTAIRQNSSYRIWLSIRSFSRLFHPCSLFPRFQWYRLRRVVKIILFLGAAFKFSYLLTYLLNTKSRANAIEPKQGAEQR